MRGTTNFRQSGVATSGWLLVALLPLTASAQHPADAPQPARTDASQPSAAARERMDKLRMFRPDFYAGYRPKTALDMVLNTPGFQLALGTSGRGLEGAAGNVLVDGVRPPAKASPITQVLAAIPADEVQAIMLVPAGSLDLDMAGHPQLLYLVTLSKPGIEGSVTVDAMDSGQQGQSRGVEVGVRLSRPRRLVSANIHNSRSRSRLQGSLVAPLIGQTSARRSGGGLSMLDSTQLSTMGQWTLQGGPRLQARLNLSQMDSDSRPLLLEGEPSTLDMSSASAQRGGDLATELQWPLADGRGELSVTALQSRRQGRSVSRVRSDDRDSLSRSRTTSGETALRGALRWKLFDAWRLQLGADHADNQQEGDFSYSIGGVEVEVPGSSSRVEEARSGVFATATWMPDPRWSTEAGLRWEQSQLRNHGDAVHVARFDDLLPRASTSWTPRSGIKLQGSAERKVGQLAFSQFLATVGLTDEIITAGAQALEPERSWVYALDYEQRFGERGLLGAGVERERIDNPIDVIVLDGGAQVSANVGAATVDAVKLQFTAPLDKLGLRGGLLTASRREVFSRTTDPVTGERREVSSTPFSASLSLRQDLAAGAWGINLSGASDSTSYSVRQVMRMQRDAGASVFGEWRPRESLALRLSYTEGGRSRSELWMHGAPRTVGQLADLNYVAVIHRPATWQARVEWTPAAAARFEFGASTGGDTRMSGRTAVPGSGETVERLTLPGQPTLSAQVKWRW